MQVIEATDCIMGRLASKVAKHLLSNEEEVHVINAEQALITGTPSSVVKKYRVLREDIGSVRKGPHFPRMPHLILKRTIRGMLPYQKPRGRVAYKRLKVHIGVPKELADEEPLVFEQTRELGTSKVMRLGEVSRTLGAKF